MVRKNTNMPMAIEDKNNDVDRDQLSEEAKMLATEKKHVCTATEKKNVPDLAN